MGNLFGIQNVYLWGAGTWVNGNTNYQAGNGLLNTNQAEIWDADFRVGKGFDFGPNLMLTPYIGAGGNWWSRNLPTVPGVALGYHEDYQHGYAGAGLLFQFVPIHRLVVSINGLVGSTFSASMRTSLIPGGAPIIPQTYALGNTIMYDAGLSFDYAFTPQFHGNLGFDFQHFGYGQSPLSVIDGSIEPTSKTNLFMVMAGLGYSFYAPAVVAKY